MIAIALFCGVSGAYAQNEEEGDELTAEMWSLYDGTGKDAEKVEGKIYNWDWQIGSGAAVGGEIGRAHV